MDEKKNVKNNEMDKKETHYPVMAPTNLIIKEDPPVAPRVNVIGRKLHRSWIRNIALWSTKLCPGLQGKSDIQSLV